MDYINIVYDFILANMSPIEIAATIFGVLSVYFTIKQHMWCWPTGIIMVTLYIYVFYDAKLYSDAILQVLFLIMNIYGWYNRTYGKKGNEKLPIKLISNNQRAMWIVGIIIVTYFWGNYMANNTDAALPHLDALNLVMSLVAQNFLSFKILETWILWINVDILSVYMYWIKGLYLTFGLYCLFLIMASIGLYSWIIDYKKQNNK